VSLSAERRLSERWSLLLGGGVSLGGDIAVGAERHQLEPGWLAMVAGSFRILDGTGYKPFLVTGLSLAAGSALAERGAEHAQLTTFDVRLSVTVGKLFGDVLGPYAVARAFGAPVLWERRGEAVIGSDQHFFQLGGGIVAALGGVVDAYLEVMPLGERSAGAGLGVMF